MIVWGDASKTDCGLKKEKMKSAILHPFFQKTKIFISKFCVFRDTGMLVLSRNGVVYSCYGGQHMYGISRFGLGELVFESKLNQFQKISEMKDANSKNPNALLSIHKIRDIACGTYHTVLLSQKNQALVCGNGKFGMIGNGRNDGNDSIYIPTILKSNRELSFCNQNIVQIRCGRYHTIMLDNKRRLFVFGYNSCNQCGVGFETRFVVPQEIRYFSDKNILIESILAGALYTYVVTKSGEFYSFGKSPACKQRILTRRIELERNDIVPVKCATFSTLFQSMDKKWYYVGVLACFRVKNTTQDDSYDIKPILGDVIKWVGEKRVSKNHDIEDRKLEINVDFNLLDLFCEAGIVSVCVESSQQS